jgi:hypothetical protein
MEEGLKQRIISKAKSSVKKTIEAINRSFNSLPQNIKKIMLLLFGVAMGGISFMLIIQALSDQEKRTLISIQRIRIPKDIYMKDKHEIITDEQLIPVGKFKGEMNGEFEAFYLAVDCDGKTYINHSPDFSKGAYEKSREWEKITRQELEEYQKQLYFFPARSKGLKH